MTNSIGLKPIMSYLDEAELYYSNRGYKPDIELKSLPKLNEIIWGLSKQTMMTVGARTSMGKSSLVIQMVSDIISMDKSVLYISFEMTQREFIGRLFSHITKVPNYDIQRGNFNKWTEKWKYFCNIMSKQRLVVTTGFGANWKELDSFLEELNKVPDVIIIDFIQGVKGSSDGGKVFIDEYLRNFRNLSIKKNFVGIIVSQLNRTTESERNKTPQMHQLKGTGFLEEHSDFVILLDWLYKTAGHKDKSRFEIIVSKNRDGRTGFIKAKFNPEVYTFIECDEEDE